LGLQISNIKVVRQSYKISNPPYNTTLIKLKIFPYDVVHFHVDRQLRRNQRNKIG